MHRVLIVSDAKTALHSFADSLRDQAEILWATRVEDAVKMAGELSPAAAVIDERVGEVDGLEAVRRLLAVNAFIDTAVVSGLDEDAFHEASEGLGLMMRLPPNPGASHARMFLSALNRLARP